MNYVVGLVRLAGFLALMVFYTALFFIDRLVMKFSDWWRWPPKL